VTNVGSRPTFADQEFAVETHLLDTAEDLYGDEIEVAFLARLRQELRFASPQALVDQVRRDVERARAFFRDTEGA
jgi:riboflavin kinase/FMN adenylyltransferase